MISSFREQHDFGSVLETRLHWTVSMVIGGPTPAAADLVKKAATSVRVSEHRQMRQPVASAASVIPIAFGAGRNTETGCYFR
jgi:hypothetical protein